MELNGINYNSLNKHFRDFSGDERDFEAIDDCNYDSVLLMINVHPYLTGYIVPSGETYAEHIITVANWIKARGKKVIIMMSANDPESGSQWTPAERWEIVVDPIKRQQWISTTVDIAKNVNPYAIHIYDEPPGGQPYGKLPYPTEDVFNAFWDLYVEMITALRAVRPNLQIWVQSAPFWDLAPIAAKPLPFSNVVYDFHLFPKEDSTCLRDVVAAFATGTPTEIAWAKDVYRRFILDRSVPEVPCRGLSVGAVIAAGLPIVCGSWGITFFPWIPELMRYHFELMKEIGAGNVYFTLAAMPIPPIPNRWGIINAGTRKLNEIGMLWCSLMPTPTPITSTVTLESIAVATTVALATLPITNNPAISAVLGLGGLAADILIRRAGRRKPEEAFDFLY